MNLILGSDVHRRSQLGRSQAMLGLIECLPATNPAAQRCAKAYEERVARQEQFARSGARLAIPVPPDLDCPPHGSGNARPQDGSALLPIDDSESRSPSVNSPASYRPAVRRPVATKHRKLQPPDPSGCRRKPFPFPRTTPLCASRYPLHRRHKSRPMQLCTRAPSLSLLPRLLLSAPIPIRASNPVRTAGCTPAGGESLPVPNRPPFPSPAHWKCRNRLNLAWRYCTPTGTRKPISNLRKWRRRTLPGKQYRAFRWIRRDGAFRRSLARFGRVPGPNQETMRRFSSDSTALRASCGKAKLIRCSRKSSLSDMRIDGLNRGFIPGIDRCSSRLVSRAEVRRRRARLDRWPHRCRRWHRHRSLR
jgi:hypothetical protein